MPGVLLHGGVGVGGRRLEEEVVCRVQPLCRMIADVLGIAGQTGPLKVGRPKRLPSILREEIVLERAEPLAVFD
jgi:hypothetical protein